MNNDNQSNNRSRGLPFPHSFNIGTTIQNVFRNINHAFASNHDSSSGQQTDNDSRDHTDDMPPLEPLNSVGETDDIRPTDIANPFPGSDTPNPSTSTLSTSAPADVEIPSRSRSDPHREDDDDSMPELRSVSELSDESTDVGIPTLNPVLSYEDDGDDPPPLEPITGTRRARVDDDGDDARDRRHPSERVGAPPSNYAAPQGANPQQLPRPPTGLFGAFFGLSPPGANPPGGDAPPEHTQTDEDAADPSPTGGRAPRGVPVLTAGFTFTIPLFGPPPGNRTGPPPGGQGGGPGLFGMDPASREELFASFAAFLQEFQAMEDAREDPERAKKLVAGLDVVPLGLVKRLERVGGAPGGHVGDANAEGSSSGCAICWDTLLDGESDNFTGQQSLEGEASQPSNLGTDTVEGRNETHTENDVMNVDAPSPSASHSEAGTSAPTPLPAEVPKIISLPCAHVFHASCLLPWFTRAKQATCPTCRFNIDPENLTYTPSPRRVFNRAPPGQTDNAIPNPVPAGLQVAPEVDPDTAAPPVDATRATEDVAPVTGTMPPGPTPLPTGPPGGMPAGPGFAPFGPIPGIPIFSFPAIQIPLRPTGVQGPGGGNQGMSLLPPAPHLRTVPMPSSTNEYLIASAGVDVVTIGLDMFVGGLPAEERDGDHRDNAEGAEGADNGGVAADGDGPANPNGFAQDMHSLIEGLLRTTRNIIPQVINAQVPVPPPAPAPDAPPAEGAQPQPQDRPAPETAGPQPVPPPASGPRVVPIFPFHPMMFQPTRPMPPRERKIWILPPAPGPSLRQRVEQREREQGLRCSDTSCGVGPSDDDPYPEPSVSTTKQVFIYPLSDAAHHENDVHASVCAHAFHPACLVSAERVAGWGGEDRAEPLVEVSCPVCRAVGCVTREEWELGVFAL